MSGTIRFPAAMSTPQTLLEMQRAISAIQTAQVFTVPEVAALPTTGRRNQLVVLNNGTDAPTLNWWNGTAWKAATMT